MSKVGIFFGSDTGNTKKVAYMIFKYFNKENVDLFDISKSSKDDIKRYNNLIFGISTWYYGEAQCDWENFFPVIKGIDLKSKNVAIFGCGDQEDYSEYFCDAMYILWNVIRNNNLNLVGKWPVANYSFKNSKSVVENGYFLGLAIDEDRQPQLTTKRVKKWVNQIKLEMNIL